MSWKRGSAAAVLSVLYGGDDGVEKGMTPFMSHRTDPSGAVGPAVPFLHRLQDDREEVCNWNEEQSGEIHYEL